MQEERNFKEARPLTKIVPSSSYLPAAPIGDSNAEKVRNGGEEIRDKYTKDAINHRQSLRDKSIDKSVDRNIERNPEMRTRVGPFYAEQREVDGVVSRSAIVPADAKSPIPRRIDLEDGRRRPSAEEVEPVGNVEVGRVGRLAAALQQRVESSNKCPPSNRFTAKKSKIKRANTIDIPSYLKLQAESLKQEGCVSLKRPINVGDKANSNSVNAMIIPSFQPRTENDRKFMALINKNNETTPVYNVPTSFKPFGCVKTADSSSTGNENWNSRFSNIKTAFDKTKTSEEEADHQVGRVKLPKRPPVVSRLAQRYNPGKEKYLDSNDYSNCEEITPKASESVSPGFRHAPSSPFRRIEKPAVLSNFVKPMAVPCEPPRSTVPPPGNTLREKARMMFDRGPGNVQQRATEYKVRVDGNSEKRGFPRPPWIEQENASSIAENGRLDYRSFCKQFAPFVGKGNVVSTQDRHLEDARRQRQGNDEFRRYRDEYSRDDDSSVVDGKISFKMITKDRDRLRGSRETDTSGSRRVDVTLSGSASVAVQTGARDDENLEEARSFRVVPRMTNGPPLARTDVSIQTSADLERNEAPENGERYKVPSAILESVRHFPPDNRSSHEEIRHEEYPARNESSDRARELRSIEENPRESVPFNEHRPETTGTSTRAPNLPVRPFVEVYEPLSRLDRSEYVSEKTNYADSDGSPRDYEFLDAKNIQNQDISEEEGIVTRYTCAIATVATSQSPDIPRELETSEVAAVEREDYRDRSTPSVSPVDEEIRRHNMLQQSLIQRLCHERCTMLDRRDDHGLYDRSQNYPNGTLHGSAVSKERAYERPRYACPPRMNEYAPTESYRKQERSTSPGPFSPSSRSKRIVDLPQAKKFLTPDPRTTRQMQRPVAASSGTSRVVNQVSALRDMYEQQPAVGQGKPMRKERSPVSNGANPIDSSDEYLMSCANQPSRSIVLSKSESWHQLALSGSCTRIASRGNETEPSSAKPAVSRLPKPPKPRSPSSMKLRTKQFEASSDSVRNMEDKIRRYFDGPNECSANDGTKETSKKRSSPRHPRDKCMIGLSRSRTLPGICEQKLVSTIPPLQVPLLQINSADVDKVFDDIFQEATRMDGRHC